MSKRVLHFTLGPVQAFVAQARRTRDLWAGSFLLSWLAGEAMRAVVAEHGAVVVPESRDDALFRAITGADRFGPAIGSLPNRFKAEVPDGFDPVCSRNAVMQAWRRLADAVWRRFVAPVAPEGNGTRAIWLRQVENFWDMSWVIGAASATGDDHAWLDRRKNWRPLRRSVEPGDHCMLMGEWQELSGFVRSHERGRQDDFWRALAARANAANKLNLEAGERLCAVALIKRLFPDVASEVLGWSPSWDGGQRVRWPSTPRLAAAGWLGHAWDKARPEAEAFADIAERTRGGLMEPPLDPGNRLSQVAGALLHRSGIENIADDELAESNGDAATARRELLEAYKAIRQKAGEPSAFYALLLMDGDKVGALLRADERAVTAGLAQFSSRVGTIIQGKRGYTVYAGGDDVLALLPLEKALPAALDLRKAYREVFPFRPEATISAAVVFAHFHVPLRHVLHEARRWLKAVAKEANERDSVATCVLSQGGVVREWVSRWQVGAACPPRLMVEAAAEIDERTSGGFFYALRERYADVIGGGLLDRDDLQRILLAEYRQSAAGAGAAPAGAARLFERIGVLAERHAGPGSPRAASAPPFAADGPMMARFLARETTRT